MSDEPDWLLWAREIQATAQCGLGFTKDPYDIERYRALTALADVNQTAAESAVREAREESGYEVAVMKLAACWDRATQGHQPAALFSITKLFFLCRLTGGAARTSLETSEVRFFAEDALPPDLSLGRVLPHQLILMFAHHRDPGLPTAFD
jgi:ADP-ribose pyrophosphatase YjhB (NUDIX family)